MIVKYLVNSIVASCILMSSRFSARLHTISIFSVGQKLEFNFNSKIYSQIIATFSASK